MKAPICEICLKNDILCGGCQKKLDDGEITELDINVSRVVYKLSQKYKSLEDVEIIKAFESGNNIYILTRDEDVPKLIGKGGKVCKELGKELGKTVYVISSSQKNIDDFIASLIKPAVIKGVNILYLPNGEEVQRYRISKKARQRMRMKKEEIEKIVKDIFNKKVEIVFE